MNMGTRVDLARTAPDDEVCFDDAHWMRCALQQAVLAQSEGEVPVGAVVVRDGRLLASGRNAPVSSHDPTAHAEVVALRAAAHALGNYRLDGCTLYVTLEPCAMCSGALLHARLERVVFGAPDPKTGAAGSVLNLFRLPQLNHHTRLDGGVLASDCSALLKAFFAPRRVNSDPLRDDALRTPLQRFVSWEPWPSSEKVITQTQITSDLPELDGLRLHSVVLRPLAEGTPGPTVLCLHGPSGSGHDFRHLATALASLGSHVLVPDLIGFGHSDKPKKETWHTPETHARVLSQWLARCSDSKRAVLVLAPDVPGTLVAALAPAAQGEMGPGDAGPLWSACVLLQGPPPAGNDAPYPDKGYRAGPRAMARWRAPAGPAGDEISPPAVDTRAAAAFRMGLQFMTLTFTDDPADHCDAAGHLLTRLASIHPLADHP